MEMTAVPGVMSLKRGCDESPSNKKGGWDICGTEAGVGAAAGAPRTDFKRKSLSGKHCSYYELKLKKGYLTSIQKVQTKQGEPKIQIL